MNRLNVTKLIPYFKKVLIELTTLLQKNNLYSCQKGPKFSKRLMGFLEWGCFGTIH